MQPYYNVAIGGRIGFLWKIVPSPLFPSGFSRLLIQAEMHV
jgi:hypothetical protein